MENESTIKRTEREFKQYFLQTEKYLFEKYGVSAQEAVFESPQRRASFNGNLIVVDKSLKGETKFFFLTHLFGHTIQRYLTPYKEFTLYRRLTLEEVRREDEYLKTRLEEMYSHEREASAYAVQLLFDVGLSHLHQWLSDYSEFDWNCVKHFLLKGWSPDLLSYANANYFQRNTAIVVPKPIPDLQLSTWEHEHRYAV
jgi:hypothetical protein